MELYFSDVGYFGGFFWFFFFSSPCDQTDDIDP